MLDLPIKILNIYCLCTQISWFQTMAYYHNFHSFTTIKSLCTCKASLVKLKWLELHIFLTCRLTKRWNWVSKWEESRAKAWFHSWMTFKWHKNSSTELITVSTWARSSTLFFTFPLAAFLTVDNFFPSLFHPCFIIPFFCVISLPTSCYFRIRHKFPSFVFASFASSNNTTTTR